MDAKKYSLRPELHRIIRTIKFCTSLKDLQAGKKIHNYVLTSGDYENIFVATSLVHMYATCDCLTEAREVFESMSQRTVVSWNCIIQGYAQKGQGEQALQLYDRMLLEKCVPDHITFLAASKACGSLAEAADEKFKASCLEKGRKIHSEAGNEVRKLAVASSLVGMYTKCGSLLEARRVFESMSQVDTVSWNCIMMGYAESGQAEVALELHLRMQKAGFFPNGVTYLAILKAHARLAEKEAKRRIILSSIRLVHFEAAENLDKFVASSLVDAYAKCGSITDARLVFEGFTHKDVVLWNCMITGYAENGEGNLALELYARMNKEGCTWNNATFVAALKACSCLGSLEAAKRIHLDIRRSQMDNLVPVATSLVDVYAKCGSMVGAQQVFDTISSKDVTIWGALIAGYSRHGDTERVFELFEKMKAARVCPDEVIFLSILTACSHAGLVDQGEDYFRIMCCDYKIKPGVDHYTCLVDVLGRANRLHDAVEVLRCMNVEANATTWLALLSACHKWKNAEVGMIAYRSLLQLNTMNSTAYVLMSDILAY